MNCKETKEKIWRVFDREASVSEKTAVREHVEGCKSCLRLYRQAESILSTVRSFEKAQAPENFTERLMNRIAQTYGYPEDRKKRAGRLQMAKYGVSFAVGVAAVLLVLVFRSPQKEAPVAFFSPSQQASLAGYERTSSFYSGKEGYVRINLNSRAELENVSVEINLPEGLVLATGEKYASWRGNLMEGRNVILLRVRGASGGEWEISGTLRKDGQETNFTRKVNII